MLSWARRTGAARKDRASAKQTWKEINGREGVFSVPRRLRRIGSRKSRAFSGSHDSKRVPGLDGEANSRGVSPSVDRRGYRRVFAYPKEPLVAFSYLCGGGQVAFGVIPGGFGDSQSAIADTNSVLNLKQKRMEKWHAR